MSQSFDASDQFAIPTTHSIPVPGRAAALTPVRGRIRAHLTVWDSTEDADASLPTVAAFVERHVDANRGFLTYRWNDEELTIDAGPLLALTGADLEHRVSPGAIFVTDEARIGAGLS
jgi:hypothetical protein